jgi:hypothetical protein
LGKFEEEAAEPIPCSSDHSLAFPFQLPRQLRQVKRGIQSGIASTGHQNPLPLTRFSFHSSFLTFYATFYTKFQVSLARPSAIAPIIALIQRLTKADPAEAARLAGYYGLQLQDRRCFVVMRGDAG